MVITLQAKGKITAEQFKEITEQTYAETH